MKRIGLFVNGRLMDSYPNDPDFYIDALNASLFATGETGMLHEVKFYEVGEEA